MRSSATLVLGGAVLLGAAACSGATPNANDIAKLVEIGHSGTTITATVSPWPLDKSTAFMCAKNPGTSFSVSSPVPPQAAQCVRLDTTAANDRLTAAFDPTKLDGASAAAFAASDPWYLAVAGSRGPLSVANVLTIVKAALPSGLAPS
jgi:ABC-type glycerol-3-phosphate transport system substrate-binding protein